MRRKKKQPDANPAIIAAIFVVGIFLGYLFSTQSLNIDSGRATAAAANAYLK